MHAYRYVHTTDYVPVRFLYMPKSKIGVLNDAQRLTAAHSGANVVCRWRTDDVMVSFAPHGGSVGAHLDNYDVFLLQGAGERQLQHGRMCHSSARGC